MPDEELNSNVENLSHEEILEAATSLLPLHDIGPFEGKTGIVKRGPGRPRKIERRPGRDDLEYHALMAVERQKFIDTDPLVTLIEGNPSDTLALLHRVKLDVAREAATLHFQRIESEKYGKDTSAISIKRVKALEEIAKIELKLRQVDQDSINLHSEKMQKIFSIWVEKMREVALELLSPELFDMFFNRFATEMSNWEDEAQNNLR
jgi:hypothetical protein